MSLRHLLVTAAMIAPVLSYGTVSAAAPLDGPVVPGVCMLGQEAVFVNSKVGQAAGARVTQLAQTAAAPLEAESQAIATEARALRAQKTPDPTKARALAQRDVAVKTAAQKLQRQVELTRVKARTQIAEAEDPVIASVFRAHSCGLLLNRDSVFGGNMTNDLTKDVIQGLDAKMTTITFDLEPFPAPAAGGR